MAEFKKFIETGGKTLDEIKKSINELVGNALDSVVDDVTGLMPRDLRKQIKQSFRDVRKKAETGEYKAERIPPKKPNIDYRTGKSVEESRLLPTENRIAYPHEAIHENLSPQDEFMLDKIREMRALEETTRNNYIVKRCAEITMVRQGDFMADVEDDFPRRVFCAIPRPIYAALSNSQLRTYFTWRTDIRRGVFSDIEKPYILLYCYELMNKIGVDSSEEAYGRLVSLWENLREKAGYLDDILPRWIKDFYAFNEICANLPETQNAELDANIVDIENGRFNGKLDFLAEYSSYNIKDSIFLTNETKLLLDGALEEALFSLSDYFTSCGAELSELLCGKLKKDHSWVPFSGAPVDLERQDGFRAVTVSPSERYCLKRGEPALTKFEFSPSRGVIGFLLKSVEAELRRRTGFKRNLIPNISMLENDVKNRERFQAAVFDEEFLKIIPRAVERFCVKNGIDYSEKMAKKIKRNSDNTYDNSSVEYTRERVEIDVSKLSKIREQSDEIAKKLIVFEEGVSDERISQITERIADDDFEERVSEFKELNAENPEPVFGSGIEAIENLPAEWREFAGSLSDEEIAFLRNLRDGTLMSYCRERNVLPEAVFEEINSAALDSVGDVVIEGGEIVPDYENEIRALLDCLL